MRNLTLSTAKPTLSTRPDGVRVLVIHRNEDVARGLQILLSGERGIDICRTALTIPVGANWARIEQPDVVILDAEMPSISPTWAMSCIREQAPGARFVLLRTGVREDEEPRTLASIDAEIVRANYPVEAVVQAVQRATFRRVPLQSGRAWPAG